ncbi:protein-disulfide reductase DsbD [Salinisphaera orenii]|uniref:protein-disulfide reductase DsbD n=1 Tax=Salinisphaera orenii TaxID=856731 RepID=UPI0019550261
MVFIVAGKTGFMVRLCARWLIRIGVVFVLSGFAASTVSAADGSGNDKFLAPDKAFSYQKQVTDDGTVKLHWSVASGYYLYRSRLKVTGKPSPVKSVQMPPGKQINDPYFGKEHIFNHDVTVSVAPGDAQQLQLTWQGCAKAGLCYPPQHATIDLQSGATPSSTTPGQSNLSTAASAGSASPGSTDSSRSTNAPASRDQALAARLAQGYIGWTLLVFFGLGLLLSFTACVLPMVPILSGVIVDAGARGLRGLTLSLAFVLPMALTYAALGVVAGLVGAPLQAILQQPAVLGAFAGVFGLLSLAMFGVFDLRLPDALGQRLQKISANRRGGNLVGAAVLGVVSALLVSPCMTAPLAGALLYIAQSGNATLGGLALFSLGLGMGTPLLVVGALGAQLLPRPGPWMTTVKAVFGFVLLATALWLIQRVTPAPVMLGLWGAWLLAIGLTLWQTAHVILGERLASSITARTAGVLLGVWGLMMVVGAAGGANDPLRPLAFIRGTAPGAPNSAADQTARFNDRFQTLHDPASLNQALKQAEARDQWTLVDFYADWCVSCQVIDDQVYGNAKVQTALAGWQLLRPDVTKDTPQTRQLMQQFDVAGPPTILFIGPDGRARRGARVVGELSAVQFLQHLDRAKGAS